MKGKYPTFSKVLMILSLTIVIIGVVYIFVEENNMTYEYTNCIITKKTGGRRGGWVHFEYIVNGKQYRGADNRSGWAIVGQTYQLKYAKEAPNDYYDLIPPANCERCY